MNRHIRRCSDPHGAATYLCEAATRSTAPIMDADDREKLCHWTSLCARYCDVSILRFCALPDRMVLLVNVPERRHVTRDELYERLHMIYAPTIADRAFGRIRYLEALGKRDQARRERERFTGRMYDISGFIYTVKRTFSARFNRHHQHAGPLWATSFNCKRVVGAEAFETLSLFIDYLPIEAGLADDPGDYPYCTASTNPLEAVEAHA